MRDHGGDMHDRQACLEPTGRAIAWPAASVFRRLRRMPGSDEPGLRLATSLAAAARARPGPETEKPGPAGLSRAATEAVGRRERAARVMVAPPGSLLLEGPGRRLPRFLRLLQAVAHDAVHAMGRRTVAQVCRGMRPPGRIAGGCVAAAAARVHQLAPVSYRARPAWATAERAQPGTGNVPSCGARILRETLQIQWTFAAWAGTVQDSRDRPPLDETTCP